MTRGKGGSMNQNGKVVSMGREKNKAGLGCIEFDK